MKKVFAPSKKKAFAQSCLLKPSIKEMVSGSEGMR